MKKNMFSKKERKQILDSLDIDEKLRNGILKKFTMDFGTREFFCDGHTLDYIENMRKLSPRRIIKFS